MMLEVSEVYKTYGPGTAQATTVLRGASYCFRDGVFYAIIGKSGCGKTTLLHILGGLDVPDQGKVLLDGVDMFGLSRRKRAILRRRRIGFIFQSYNLLQEHTALENIAMPYVLDGERLDQDRLSDVCAALEIEQLLHKYPSQLSGGEQQRVAIARAIIRNPSIVFADEPTGNLDPQTADATVALLKKIVEQFGTTLILVTHDMEVAAESQEIIRIESGQIVPG